MFESIREWINSVLWGVDLRQESRWRALYLGAGRVAAYAYQSFSHNLVGIQASGLTSITMLGIVPTLWLFALVARWLGFFEQLEARVISYRNESGTPQLLASLIDNFHQAIDRVSLQALGFIGCGIVAYAGYNLFINVQRTFDHVWRVKGYPWYRRLGGFLGLVVVVPVLFLSGIIGESLLRSGPVARHVSENYPSFFAVVYESGLRFTPTVLIWLTFTLIYKLMPSARVHWRPAMLAAVIPAIGLFAIHGIYLEAQGDLAIYNKVYATLAALPMLIVYLTVTWTIILAGAQVCYAVQHVHDLRPPDFLKARKKPPGPPGGPQSSS